MGKKIEITPAIQAKIIRSTGDPEYDFSKISVFEATALNTLPVSKRGLFNGAVAPEMTLMQMANYVSKDHKESVPMHIIHETDVLPVGRVFDAQVLPDENGVPSLQALFFIGNEHQNIVAGVDNGSIDEVSVGVRSQHLNCSQCGWDFLGAESTMDNIWEARCANDHVMGENGAHVILNGLERWMELSLVPLGAGKNPKILSRTKSLLGNSSYEKLAASGIAPEVTTFFASHKQKSPTQSEPNMDLKEAVTLNAELSGKLSVAEYKATAAETKVTALTTENTELKAKVADLEAKKADPEELKTVKASLETAQTSLKASTEYVRKEADRLCVVLGVDKLPETATFAELTASIDGNRAKVKETFEKKEVTDGAAQAAPAKAASFKTVR